MGKKLQWNRNYSQGYLADISLQKLSFAAHGMLKIINDILWTQTDEPGYYIKHGHAGDDDELISDCKQYAIRSARGRNQYAIRSISELYQVHALARTDDGVIFSPFIVNEVDISNVRSEAGTEGAKICHSKTKRLPSTPRKPRTEENITEKNRIDNNNVIRARIIPNPPKIRFSLRDYQQEVLNKCEHRNSGEEHPAAAMLYRIAEQVPEEIVQAALAATQDKNQRDTADGRPTKSPTAYYLATVRNMCRDNRVETTIKWKE